jgi:hypothetical protein
MTPSQQILYDKAQRERALVCEWLMEMMRQSSQKPATKDTLRELAMEKFGVSRNSFDAGWNVAIMSSGNEHWWDPLPRSKKAVRD